MICVRLAGGLGNQMFQYALGYILAKKHKTELTLDGSYLGHAPANNPDFVKRHYSLGIFDIQGRLLRKNERFWMPVRADSIAGRVRYLTGMALGLHKKIHGIDIVYERRRFIYDEEVWNAGSHSYLVGFWQNPRYLEETAHALRAEFRLNRTLPRHILELGAEILATNALCINLRRGDFLSNPTHNVLSPDYHSRATAMILKHATIDKVYIFSDDIDWCRENIKPQLPHVHVGHEYAGVDYGAYMWLMSICKHFVIPNSTFAWWSAWLANYPDKKIVAPRIWADKSEPDAGEIVPTSWMRI